MLDVSEYEALMEKLELLKDIHIAETQLQRGNGVEHQEAKKQIRIKISTRMLNIFKGEIFNES